MSRKDRRFRGEFLERLESRLALASGLKPAATLVAGLAANSPRRGPSPKISDQIDAAFDSFLRDYLEAQAAYLASGTDTAITEVFKEFVTQRVNLLSQELTMTMSRLPGSLNRLKGKMRTNNANSDIVLQAFLRRQITGGVGTMDGDGTGSLLMSLTSSQALPPPGTSGSAATLYTLTATNAIEAARSSAVNAAKFLVNGNFQSSHSK